MALVSQGAHSVGAQVACYTLLLRHLSTEPITNHPSLAMMAAMPARLATWAQHRPAHSQLLTAPRNGWKQARHGVISSALAGGASIAHPFLYSSHGP